MAEAVVSRHTPRYYEVEAHNSDSDDEVCTKMRKVYLRTREELEAATKEGRTVCLGTSEHVRYIRLISNVMKRAEIPPAIRGDIKEKVTRLATSKSTMET